MKTKRLTSRYGTTFTDEIYCPLLMDGWSTRIKSVNGGVPIFEYRKKGSGWLSEDDAENASRRRAEGSRVHELTQMLRVAEGALMSCAEALEVGEPYVAEAAWSVYERSKALRKRANDITGRE